MTRAEWDRIAAVLDNGFPGHFGEAESATYWLVLGNETAPRVERAVLEAVKSGARYRPTPSELYRFMPNGAISHESQFMATAERYGVEKAREFFPESEFSFVRELTP